MNIQKTKAALTPLTSLFAILIALTVVSFSAQQVYAAPVDTNPGGEARVKSTDLKETIIAKCTFAKSRYSGDKKSAGYKDFVAACDMTGIYRPNGNGLSERAKRLLIICGYGNILKESGKYDAYNKRGAAGYRDCDVVKRNADVQDVANRAANYPAVNQIKDPARKCSLQSNADECDLMKKYVNPFISFLSVFVGLAVVIGLISGGIRYASAGDDPQKVSSAKNMIRNAIIVLIAFIFLYAAIQWMIPQTG